jgi:hypothetical protein
MLMPNKFATMVIKIPKIEQREKYSLIICGLFLIGVFIDHLKLYNFEKTIVVYRIVTALRYTILGIAFIWSMTNSIEIVMYSKKPNLRKSLWATISFAPIIYTLCVLMYFRFSDK